MSKIRVICILLIMFIILPRISIAAQLQCIYGVTIHLKNNERIDGYIEGDAGPYKCNEQKNVNIPYELTWKALLENQGTVRFINKLIKVKYIKFYEGNFHNISSLVVAKSSVKEIDLADIKSIESICRTWDGHETFSGIPVITDHMAEVISKYEFIASYLYDSDELAKDSGEPCGLCSGETIFLSYNPKYTRKELSKLRYKLYKMSDDELEKERLVRFTQAFD